MLSLFSCIFGKGHENILANPHVLNTLSLYLTFFSLNKKPVISPLRIIPDTSLLVSEALAVDWDAANQNASIDHLVVWPFWNNTGRLYL